MWHVSQVHVPCAFRGRGLGTRMLDFLFSRYPNSSFYMYSDWNNPEFNPKGSFKCYVRAALKNKFLVFLSYEGLHRNGRRSGEGTPFSSSRKKKSLTPNWNGKWIQVIDRSDSNTSIFDDLPSINNNTPAIIPKSRIGNNEETTAVKSWRVLLFLPNGTKQVPQLG
mmetsp:Transcript_5940/g.11915  ORF Transcript_5940/g.11915 Transcript_5940/m.11915 type:complete len:166 (-) Transcript_5940:214-711(-)